MPYNEDAVSRPTSGTSGGPNFLDNLWVEVIDEPYENGVVGKHVIFHIEERPRIKVVDYVPAVGTKTRSTISKIEETLKEQNDRRPARHVRRRGDDPARQGRHPRALRREGLQRRRRSTPTLTRAAGGAEARGPDVQHRPRVRRSQIREVVFDGNKAFSDGKLRGQMKENKPKSWLSFITERGHLPGSEVRRRRREGARVLRTRATRARRSGSRRSRPSRTRRTARRAGSGCGFRSTRARVQGRQVRDRRRHVAQARVPPSALQDEGGRRLQPRRSSARASRRRRRSTARSASGSGRPTVDVCPRGIDPRDRAADRSTRRRRRSWTSRSG